MIDELGGPKHFNHFPSAWAHAMDTPFQWTKQIASHFGGTRNPMIVSWPARIKDKGGAAHAVPAHASTSCRRSTRLIGITPPDELNGVQQKPIEGISFAYTFDDAKAPEPAHHAVLRDGQQPRHLPRRLDGVGHRVRALGADPRRASTPTRQKWELYNIDEDFSQADDLAAREPAEAATSCRTSGGRRRPRYNVLPLDWRGVERLNAELHGPAEPRRRRARRSPTTPARSALPNEAAPRMLNKSWTLTADIEVPEAGAEGMIVTHGGLVGGYGLYLRDGKPTFVYNYLALERSTFAGQEPLPKGKVKLEVDFAYEGGAASAARARR